MRVAIIGGTGFVGSYIVDELLRQGHDVSALVREGSEHKVRQPDLTHVVSGDLDDTSSIGEVVRGCDAVIYCVGILREFPRKGITFETTQYYGVARTVEAALSKGVKRFVLMSANGVKIPGTRYQETKQRAEDLVLASDLNATVFRPSVVFGDPRGRMEFATQLFRDMVDKPIPAVGFFSGLNPTKGAILMSPVHVEDTARAFVNALTDTSTVGKSYDLGGPDILSWTEIIQRVATAAGRKKWIIPFPIGVMKLAATFLDWLPFFPATRDQLTMLAEGNTAAPEVIESLIGSAPVAFSPEHLAYLGDTDFTLDSADLGWYVLNDNVMGGRSNGDFDQAQGELRFTGNTNTNGGGFSSIRTKALQLDLSDHSGVQLRVHGDGRRYTWRLSTAASSRGRQISYWADFETREGEWITVTIPFDRFIPRFRGVQLDGPALDTEQITGMGIMIYDKQDGPFELRLSSMQALRRAPDLSQ